MTDDAKIKRGAPRRDPTCYRTRHEIVIPAGTMLRDAGDGKFAADVGVGSVTMLGKLSITVKPGDPEPSLVFEKVIAA